MPFEPKRSSSANTVVLFVHGIQGSPSQFAWLAEMLPDHVDYLCLLLPGHGASIREFSAAGYREWTKSVFETIHSLSSRYQRIIYVGHSMGCLLGILSAAADAPSPDSMLLLACPLVLRPTLHYFLNNYRSVIQKTPSDPWIMAAKEANSVHARHPIAYVCCIKPYLSLLKLMGKARKILPRLTMPIIAVHSERDEIVGRKSLTRLSKHAHAETLLASGSGHFLYSEEAKQFIANRLFSLLDSSSDS